MNITHQKSFSFALSPIPDNATETCNIAELWRLRAELHQSGIR